MYKFFISQLLSLVIVFSPCLLLAKEINLIWLTSGTIWETDWVREILSDVDATIHEVSDLNYENVLDHSIIVTSFPDTEKYRRYYQAFREKGYKFGIIHLSDEAYEHPVDFYEGAQFVLRNYWHANLCKKNISAFALGYKEHFWKNYPVDKPFLSAGQRQYTWSFAGQIKKTTRMNMFMAMKRIPRHYVHDIPHFAAQSMLPVDQYRDMLLNTVFAPCPRGNINLDTFRLSEALECGCIPIVEKFPVDYFAQLFGDYPFPAVNNWDEAPLIVRQLLADPHRLEELQQRCHTWWCQYKDNLKKKVADLVENTL